MKANHYLTLSAVIVTGLASCTSESLVNEITQTGKTNEQAVMSFDVHTQNQTRTTTALQNTYYDFGVWAYKNMPSGTTDGVYQEVMPNYLVGYYDETNKKGYYGNGTATIGDANSSTDGQSMWFYEGLGNDNTNGYKHSNGDGEEYTTSSPSVNATQDLQYWDYNSISTDFFAYAPYGHGDLYEFNSTDKEIKTKDWVWAGFSNQKYQEKLLAHTTIEKTNYGKDVQLTFNRINAAVQLAFYAPIPGFDTQITSVSVECAHQETTGEVTTIAIDKDKDMVAYGTKVKMGTTGEIVVTESEFYHIATDPTAHSNAANKEPNWFGLPGTTVNDRDNIIGKTNTDLSESPNTFFAMPANTEEGKKNSGFKVTVGFKLYSQNTNETQEMVGYVFVPDTYTQWRSNFKYVYVFKLTHETPIVFDGVTISEYSTGDTGQEYIIEPTVINTTFPSTLIVSTSENAGSTDPEDAETNGYKNFEFSVNAKQLPSENVKAVIDVSGSTAIIQSLQYYETNPSKTQGWTSLTATDEKYTFDAGGSGFPLQNNVPLKLRIRVSTEGTVTAKIQIVGFTSGTVYGETTVSATVSNPS